MLFKGLSPISILGFESNNLTQTYCHFLQALLREFFKIPAAASVLEFSFIYLFVLWLHARARVFAFDLKLLAEPQGILEANIYTVTHLIFSERVQISMPCPLCRIVEL